MSEILHRFSTWYRLRLLPTVKRMFSPRRRAYTGSVIGTLTVSAIILSLVCGFYATLWANARAMLSDFEILISSTFANGIPSPALSELRGKLLTARADVLASLLFALGLWLLLSLMAIRWVMKYVLDVESETYALYMIFGSDQKQLRRQIGTEFALSGALALICGVPVGLLICQRLTEKPFPVWCLWVILFGFAILAGTISATLSRRLLGQPLPRLLNATDTSPYTTSPRRSMSFHHARQGLSPLHTAAVGFWRMRTYFLSIALAVGVLSACICNVLTPTHGQGSGGLTDYTVSFANGISYGELEERYLDVLQDEASIRSIQYAVGNTAEALGTHVLLDASQTPQDDFAIYTGDRFATDAIRIVCGDGEVGAEMGGGTMVPGIWNDQYVPPYDIRPVASGTAILVRPADAEGKLTPGVGDTVQLCRAGSESTEKQSQVSVHVRVTDVIEVPAFYSADYPPQYIRPRITEEMLLLSPMDYSHLTGKQHASEVQVNEAYPTDVFQNDRSCILVLPNGYTFEQDTPSAVTVISPAETLKRAFYDALDKENLPTLPTDTFYVDTSLSVTGIYLGTRSQYEENGAAVSYMKELPFAAYQNGLVDSVCETFRTNEYRIERIVYHDGETMPYVLLPKQETTGYTQLCTEVSALGLFPLTDETPLLFQTAQEAYLLQTEQTIQHSYLLLGTALLPEFVSYANRHGFHLFFSHDDYAVTATTISGNFSINGRRFALACPTPHSPYICSDDYPLLITGTGSCSVSERDLHTVTTQSAADCGVYGIFHADSIGALKAQSQPIDGMYARNDRCILPDCEASFGRLADGTAVYVTAEDIGSCPIQAGDTVQVAVRFDPALIANEWEYANLDGMQKLRYQLNFPTDYIEVKVREVVSGSEDSLVLSEADFCRMTNTDGIYEKISVSVYPLSDIKEHLTLCKRLQHATDQGKDAALTCHNRAVYAATTGEAKQSALWQIVGLPALLMIPLVIATAQRVFYDKRREEYAILHAMGKTRRALTATVVAEGLLLALVTATLGAVLALPFHILLLWWANTVGMPLTYTSMDLRLLGAILAIVIVSCILPTLTHARHIIASTVRSGRGEKGRHKNT